MNKKLILLLCVLFLALPLALAVDYEMLDTFEDGNTTDAGDFFVTGTNYATEDQAYKGTWSMQLEPGALYSIDMNRAFNETRVEFWVYIPSGTKASTISVGDTAEQGAGSGVYVGIETSGVRYYDGSDWIYVSGAIGITDWYN